MRLFPAVLLFLACSSVVHGQDKSVTDQSLSDFLVATMYSTRGDCEKAIPLFRRALALHKDAVIFRQLAECYYFQGNMETAIELLEESVRLFPEDPLNHIALGTLYYDLYRSGMASDQISSNALTHLKRGWEMAGDVESGARAVEMAVALKDAESAVSLFESLPIEIRKHPMLLGFMIPIYAERKQFNHVQKAMRMLINSDVENPAFLEQVANLAINRSFYTEALHLMMQRIQLDPDTFTDWDRLMFVALAAEECGEVETIFNDHYRDSPTALALYSLGNCAGRAHAYTRSADLFGRALQLGEQNWNSAVYVDVVRDYLKVLVAGRMDDMALTVARGALKKIPDHKGLAMDLVFVECLNGNFAEAKALLEAMSENPDVRLNTQRLRAQVEEKSAYPSLYFRGIVLYALDDFGPAAGELTAAYRLVKDDVDVVVALAFMLDREGKHAEVIRIYRDILKHYPEDPLILNNLSYSLLIYNDNMEEGLTLGRRAVSLEPDNPIYRDTLGYGLLLKGSLEEAMEHLIFAYEKMPENGEVCEHLGELYFKRGDLDKARELWLEAIENGDVDEDTIRNRIRFLDR